VPRSIQAAEAAADDNDTMKMVRDGNSPDGRSDERTLPGSQPAAIGSLCVEL
jgi:hypothetical protein